MFFPLFQAASGFYLLQCDNNLADSQHVFTLCNPLQLNQVEMILVNAKLTLYSHEFEVQIDLKPLHCVAKLFQQFADWMDFAI